jgi:hypothetical protein
MAGTWLPSKPSLHEPHLTSNGSSAACHYRRTSLTAHKVRKLPSPFFGPAQVLKHTNILLFHLVSQSQTASFLQQHTRLDQRGFLSILSSRACGQLVETCSYRFPSVFPMVQNHFVELATEEAPGQQSGYHGAGAFPIRDARWVLASPQAQDQNTAAIPRELRQNVAAAS